ncbi:hypothetical protein CP500_007290 [Tychonema bourrellyi FEM_GT703]|uniref:Uncharacterized protein n=1 Tax=Tychonema bourrellyi FEM_GT703 TaxID=2040638 RepID=A0A2G4F2X4_9CYAN|nr:hypothetical protein [Tychonema bourrellyi]PHX56102.1 hypothetical protein CP500_007290 [Tychonema bourrellyi FEM_GT703]
MCIGQPDSPACKAVTGMMITDLEKITDHMSQLIIEIKRNSPILDNPKPPRIDDRFAMAEAPSGNRLIIESVDTEDEKFSDDDNFYDLDLVIKDKSANLGAVIVDLIVTNQVGDNPERIRGIRLKIARFVKDLKALEIADIKPEIKKEISDRMKATMSAILEEILTH